MDCTSMKNPNKLRWKIQKKINAFLKRKSIIFRSIERGAIHTDDPSGHLVGAMCRGDWWPGIFKYKYRYNHRHKYRFKYGHIHRGRCVMLGSTSLLNREAKVQTIIIGICIIILPFRATDLDAIGFSTKPRGFSTFNFKLNSKTAQCP